MGRMRPVTIIAAADGSALGNPGPAGWGWYVDDDCWAVGGWAHGTNNKAELTAVLDLLQQTAHLADDLLVYCDSTYVINSVTKWMAGWKRRGWKKGDGKPVLNVEIMQALDEAMSGRRVRFAVGQGPLGPRAQRGGRPAGQRRGRVLEDRRGPDRRARASPARVAGTPTRVPAPVVRRAPTCSGSCDPGRGRSPDQTGPAIRRLRPGHSRPAPVGRRHARGRHGRRGLHVLAGAVSLALVARAVSVALVPFVALTRTRRPAGPRTFRHRIPGMPPVIGNDVYSADPRRDARAPGAARPGATLRARLLTAARRSP